MHELGHCVLSNYHIKIDQVAEEMFVNRFAVAYWRVVDGCDYLCKLKTMLEEVLGRIPNPVALDETFEEFFNRLFLVPELGTVELYGFCQLTSVLKALQKEENLDDVLNEVGIVIDLNDVNKYQDKISAEKAKDILALGLENLHNMGIQIDPVEFELVDNPEIQCASQD